VWARIRVFPTQLRLPVMFLKVVVEQDCSFNTTHVLIDENLSDDTVAPLTLYTK